MAGQARPFKQLPAAAGAAAARRSSRERRAPPSAAQRSSWPTAAAAAAAAATTAAGGCWLLCCRFHCTAARTCHSCCYCCGSCSTQRGHSCPAAAAAKAVTAACICQRINVAPRLPHCSPACWVMLGTSKSSRTPADGRPARHCREGRARSAGGTDALPLLLLLLSGYGATGDLVPAAAVLLFAGWHDRRQLSPNVPCCSPLRTCCPSAGSSAASCPQAPDHHEHAPSNSRVVILNLQREKGKAEWAGGTSERKAGGGASRRKTGLGRRQPLPRGACMSPTQALQGRRGPGLQPPPACAGSSEAPCPAIAPRPLCCCSSAPVAGSRPLQAARRAAQGLATPPQCGTGPAHRPQRTSSCSPAPRRGRGGRAGRRSAHGATQT